MLLMYVGTTGHLNEDDVIARMIVAEGSVVSSVVLIFNCNLSKTHDVGLLMNLYLVAFGD